MGENAIFLTRPLFLRTRTGGGRFQENHAKSPPACSWPKNMGTRSGVVYGFFVFFCSRRISASLTNRQKGTPKPWATQSATLTLGLRSPLSIKEIIFEDKSARSANSSWDKSISLRRCRTIVPKNWSNSLEHILPRWQRKEQSLQEQL